MLDWELTANYEKSYIIWNTEYPALEKGVSRAFADWTPGILWGPSIGEQEGSCL